MSPQVLRFKGLPAVGWRRRVWRLNVQQRQKDGPVPDLLGSLFLLRARSAGVVLRDVPPPSPRVRPERQVKGRHCPQKGMSNVPDMPIQKKGHHSWDPLERRFTMAKNAKRTETRRNIQGSK
jgi:hypothetical protein